jgi:hypothetical protein
VRKESSESGTEKLQIFNSKVLRKNFVLKHVHNQVVLRHFHVPVEHLQEYPTIIAEPGKRSWGNWQKETEMTSLYDFTFSDVWSHWSDTKHWHPRNVFDIFCKTSSAMKRKHEGNVFWSENIVTLSNVVVYLRTATFSVQKFYVLPTKCITCFVWISGQLATLYL